MSKGFTGSSHLWLTTGVDSSGTLVGSGGTTSTTGNDTFNGLSQATAAATTDTLTVADVINGGAGTDTLNITVSAINTDVTDGALISGIEIVSIRNIAATTVDAAYVAGAGVTTVNSNLSTGDVSVTGLATGATVGYIGNGTVVNGALSASYLTTATGAATLNISGGTTIAAGTTGNVALIGAALTSAVINSSGAANTIGAVTGFATATSVTVNATSNLTTGAIGGITGATALTLNANGGKITTGAITAAAAVTTAITGTSDVSTNLAAVVAPTITVSGSGAVSIGTLNAASLTLTSTQTGGSLTATMNGVATTKVTGGAGNDVITTGVALTTGFADGGAGTDTLVLGAVGHANTTTLAAKYTNFETLRLAGTFDTSLISGITAIETTGTVVLTGMSAAQAANVTVRADTAATSTFALLSAGGTTDVLNLKMGLGTTTAPATNAVGAVVVEGFETLNITAAAGPTAATAAALLSSFDTAFTGTTLSRINLSGSAVSIANAATTVAATWDASALTGDANATNAVTAAATKGLTLAGTLAAGSTVTGSNFIDTITIGAVGASNNTYNLGGGNDAISSLYANLRTASVYNNIDGGAGTTDTLTVSDGAAVALTMVDADFKGLTNIERITVTSTTSAAQSITTGGFFDTNFKTAGSTLTTTSTTGAIVVDQSSFSGTNAVTASSTTGAITIRGGSGNNTITATSTDAGGGGIGVITIVTLGGNDVVTVTTAATTITSTISTGAGNDTIVGSLGVETITGGTGADTMTGGGGADVFAIGAGTSLAASMDIITDFNTAVADTLSFAVAQVVLAADTSALVAGSNVQTSAGGLVTFATADNTFALKLAAIQADTQLDAAQSIAVFQDSGNTYVYSAGAATGNADDQIIQLTGITGTAADVITGTGTTTITIA
jgi:S-layer protein